MLVNKGTTQSIKNLVTVFALSFKWLMSINFVKNNKV